MGMADSENYTFGRDTQGVFPTLLHEFPHNSIIRTGVGDRSLNIRSFKVKFFEVYPFSSDLLL